MSIETRRFFESKVYDAKDGAYAYKQVTTTLVRLDDLVTSQKWTPLWDTLELTTTREYTDDIQWLNNQRTEYVVISASILGSREVDG